MNSTLRFGIFQLQNRSWAALAENCQMVESLGYDSFWVGDHFVNGHNLEEDVVRRLVGPHGIGGADAHDPHRHACHEHHLSQPRRDRQTSPHR